MLTGVESLLLGSVCSFSRVASLHSEHLCVTPAALPCSVQRRTQSHYSLKLALGVILQEHQLVVERHTDHSYLLASSSPTRQGTAHHSGLVSCLGSCISFCFLFYVLVYVGVCVCMRAFTHVWVCVGVCSMVLVWMSEDSVPNRFFSSAIICALRIKLK